MDTSALFDLAAPVRYALTHRAAAGDRVDLVLDLFRGAVQIHSRVIASVEREQAVLVMAKCRRYLQLRGVDAAAVAPAAPKAAPAKAVPAAAPAKPSPVPAPKPAAVAMRPAPGVKPMAIPKPPATAVKRMPVPAIAKARPAPRDQAPAGRAPAAAAFDWMFEAV